MARTVKISTGGDGMTWFFNIRLLVVSQSVFKAPVSETQFQNPSDRHGHLRLN